MSEREIVKILAAARFKPRSDTLANWKSKNPILLAGEPGVVIDGTETDKVKIGDGITPWNELSWWRGPKGVQGVRGVSGVYVGSGDMPDGYNIQIDPGGVIKPEDFAISVDNKYNPNSTNAQSGIAVKEAVLEAKSEANTYTDQAKSEANTYTDQAKSEANTYTDQAKSEANTYTDQAILNLKLLEKLQELSQSVLLAAHPVGSYYWSSDATEPSILFGGEWEQVQGKFILAAGTYTDKNGEERTFEVGDNDLGEYGHTLTVDEMPSHTHRLRLEWEQNEGGGIVDTWSDPSHVRIDMYGSQTSSTGGNQPHNNMPPYEVAYCWKRIA